MAPSPPSARSDSSFHSIEKANALNPDLNASISVFAVGAHSPPAATAARSLSSISRPPEFTISTWSAHTDTPAIISSSAYHPQPPSFRAISPDAATSPQPSSSASSEHGMNDKKTREGSSHVPRPPNSFMLFKQDYVSATSGRQKGGNSTRLIGLAWAALSDEERAKWTHKAELVKEQHAIDHPGYKYQPKSRKPKNVEQAPTESMASTGSTSVSASAFTTRGEPHHSDITMVSLPKGTITRRLPSKPTRTRRQTRKPSIASPAQSTFAVDIPSPLQTSSLSSSAQPPVSPSSLPCSSPISFPAPRPIHPIQHHVLESLGALKDDAPHSDQASSCGPASGSPPMTYDSEREWMQQQSHSRYSSGMLFVPSSSLDGYVSGQSEVGPHRRNREIRHARSFQAPYRTPSTVAIGGSGEELLTGGPQSMEFVFPASASSSSSVADGVMAVEPWMSSPSVSGSTAQSYRRHHVSGSAPSIIRFSSPLLSSPSASTGHSPSSYSHYVPASTTECSFMAEADPTAFGYPDLGQASLLSERHGGIGIMFDGSELDPTSFSASGPSPCHSSGIGVYPTMGSNEWYEAGAALFYQTPSSTLSDVLHQQYWPPASVLDSTSVESRATPGGDVTLEGLGFDINFQYPVLDGFTPSTLEPH